MIAIANSHSPSLTWGCVELSWEDQAAIAIAKAITIVHRLRLIWFCFSCFSFDHFVIVFSVLCLNHLGQDRSGRSYRFRSNQSAARDRFAWAEPALFSLKPTSSTVPVIQHTTSHHCCCYSCLGRCFLLKVDWLSVHLAACPWLAPFVGFVLSVLHREKNLSLSDYFSLLTWNIFLVI